MSEQTRSLLAEKDREIDNLTSTLRAVEAKLAETKADAERLRGALRRLHETAPDPGWCRRHALDEDADPASMIEAANREYREALVAADAALSTPSPDHATPASDRFDCLACGIGVKADEDGCCAVCGHDCVIFRGGVPTYPAIDLHAEGRIALALLHLRSTLEAEGAPSPETRDEPARELAEALRKIEELAFEALDASDPIVFEKDWCSDDPSDAYRAVMNRLTHIRDLARYRRGPSRDEGLSVRACGDGIAYPGIEGKMPTASEEEEIDKAMRASRDEGTRGDDEHPFADAAEASRAKTNEAIDRWLAQDERKKP